MTTPAPINLHATALTWGERAVLLCGEAGSGKSSLALALLTHQPEVPTRGNAETEQPQDPSISRWRLLADDQVHLAIRRGRIVASCPPAIRHRIEVRGYGILPVPAQWQVKEPIAAPVALVCQLQPQHQPARLPEDGSRQRAILGIDVPLLTLGGCECWWAGRVALVLSKIIL